MPVWVQVILAAAAVVGSLGVLWSKVVLPAFRLAQAADDLAPLLREITVAFAETPPGAFLVLEEIAAEFRTDSGSTLRDAVNRLDDAVRSLTVGAEAMRQLDGDQRAEVARLAVMLGEVLLGVDENKQGVARMETAAVGVASDLAAAKVKVEGVADDLAASHDRANASESGEAGSSADAAAQLPPDHDAPPS